MRLFKGYLSLLAGLTITACGTSKITDDDVEGVAARALAQAQEIRLKGEIDLGLTDAGAAGTAPVELKITVDPVAATAFRATPKAENFCRRDESGFLNCSCTTRVDFEVGHVEATLRDPASGSIIGTGFGTMGTGVSFSSPTSWEGSSCYPHGYPEADGAEELRFKVTVSMTGSGKQFDIYAGRSVAAVAFKAKNHGAEWRLSEIQYEVHNRENAIIEYGPLNQLPYRMPKAPIASEGVPTAEIAVAFHMAPDNCPPTLSNQYLMATPKYAVRFQRALPSATRVYMKWTWDARNSPFAGNTTQPWRDEQWVELAPTSGGFLETTIELPKERVYFYQNQGQFLQTWPNAVGLGAMRPSALRYVFKVDYADGRSEWMNGTGLDFGDFRSEVSGPYYYYPAFCSPPPFAEAQSAAPWIATGYVPR
ncbi:MAG: hypothetical protein ACT4TC_11345 [Myxococcaceae bacterium]